MSKSTIDKKMRITKNGKIIHRTCGQNHFNAKEKSKITRNKRRDKKVVKDFHKTIIKLI